MPGVAAATPGIAFAGFGFFAKLLFTAEFFGSGFSRDMPITAFLSFSHSPSRIASHSSVFFLWVFMAVSIAPAGDSPRSPARA